MRKVRVTKDEVPGDGLVMKKKKAANVRKYIYAVLATILVYTILIVIEKSATKEDKPVNVYVAKEDISENVFITKENVDKYLEIQERPAYTLVSDYITDLSAVETLKTARVIKKNQVITQDCFAEPSDYPAIKGIENPMEVSLNSASLSSVVGGVIRAGDYINVWAVKNTNLNGIREQEIIQICDHAYVTRGFTATGEEVEAGNEDKATTVVNIVIPKEKEAEFVAAVEDGNIRIGRYMYEPDGR